VKAAILAHGRAPVERAIQAELARVRTLVHDGEAFAREVAGLDASIADRGAREARLSLVRVINATGVVVHTNLGRSPLSNEIASHVARIASSYSNLEYDLAAGERGHRETHAEGRLRSMLRAEASVVLNNNAAAVLLAVNTLAEGREVLVSRGELVEIGGSFRIPDVIAKSGARLREVGTTNRTRISDFEKAISPETGLILRVHPSNFRIVGFTESASLTELVALGRARGIPVVEISAAVCCMNSRDRSMKRRRSRTASPPASTSLPRAGTSCSEDRRPGSRSGAGPRSTRCGRILFTARCASTR